QNPGDCLFEALCHQLKYTKTADTKPRELRQNLVAYIKQNTQLENGDHVMTLFDTTTNDEWRVNSKQNEKKSADEMKLSYYTDSYMNKPETTGDTLMIWACSQLYDVDFEIFPSASDRSYKISAKDDDSIRATVRLGFVGQAYFVSLVSTNKESTEFMYLLGRKIKACDQVTEIKKQAGLMSDLGL
ncbi:unnamed protein product, partial [Owenia fusiformis]